MTSTVVYTNVSSFSIATDVLHGNLSINPGQSVTLSSLNSALDYVVGQGKMTRTINGTVDNVISDDSNLDPGGIKIYSSTDASSGADRFIESLVRNPDSIIVGVITRDANGAVSSATVKFPDGTDGVYTTLVASTAFPGAVDSYSVTYGSKTYTQPSVTRDASGAVTNRPALAVS